MTEITVVTLPPRKPRKPLKRGLGAKKPRKTKVDLCRLWLVPQPPSSLRYTGLRGIYWYWLSRDVRKTEWEKWNHLCLTCLTEIEDWTKADCGHIVASRFCGEFLRLNRVNLTIQHKKCNNPRFCPQAGVMNAVNYNKRYGPNKFEELLEMRHKQAKEPSQEEYRQLIQSLPSYQEALLKTLSP